MSKEAKLNSLLRKLSEDNKAHSIKIRTKPLKSGGYSLFLDHFQNYKHHYEFLPGLRLSDNEQENKTAIAKAQKYRNRLEESITDESLGISTNWKRKSDFLEYFQTVAAQRRRRLFKYAYNHIKAYSGKPITFAVIDRNWVEGFREYLLGTGINPNTAAQYLAILKTVLTQAVRDEIITNSPAQGVTIKSLSTKRIFLTVGEVKAIADTDCRIPEIREAFLFGCYTGLRISDIERLTWDNIEGNHYSIRQKKTKDPLRNLLIPKALEILANRDHSTKRIFDLPGRTLMGSILTKLAQEAGITKRVTFHTSRHTFAVTAINEGVDIYTLSKLLGHSNQNTTQAYAKVTDLKKDEASKLISEAWE